MLFKLSQTQKLETQKETVKKQDRYYPIYYAIMGFMFAGILLLSAANDFLFFEWLCISMAIIFGLLSIHLMSESQTKRS